MSTQRFGFENDGLTVGKFATVDRDLLDRLLAYLEIHDHSGGATPVPLADPDGAPTVSLDDTDGALADGQTLYYKVSYLDAFGLETAASDEVEIELPAAPISDEPPIPTGGTADSGSLPLDTYYYALTVISIHDVESPLGPPAIITVVEEQNAVDLALPELPDGGASYNIWRMALGDEGWTKVATAVTDPTSTDAGVPRGDCPTDPTTQPPDLLAVSGTNTVTITVPGGTIPSDVQAWRLYRSDTSESYGLTALIAEVVADEDEDLPTTYVDDGGPLLDGAPLDVSSTLRPSIQVSGGGGGGGGTAAPTDGKTLATAFPLTDGSGQIVTDSTSNVTGDASRAHPVWFTFKATRDAHGSFDAGGSGPGYDAYMYLYSGPDNATSIDALVLVSPDSSTWQLTVDDAGAVDTAQLNADLVVVAEDDDSRGDGLPALMSQPLEAGTRYYVLVSDYATGAGSSHLTLNWAGVNADPPIDGKTVLGAFPLTDGSGQIVVDNTPNVGADGYDHGVWAKFTATTANPVTIDSFGTGADTVVEVFTPNLSDPAAQPDSSTLIALQDETGEVTPLTFTPDVGQAYLVLLGTYSTSTASDHATLNWSGLND